MVMWNMLQPLPPHRPPTHKTLMIWGQIPLLLCLRNVQDVLQMIDLQQLKPVIVPGKEPISHICHKWSTCGSPSYPSKSTQLKMPSQKVQNSKTMQLPHRRREFTDFAKQTSFSPNFPLSEPTLTHSDAQPFFLIALFYKSPSQVNINLSTKWESRESHSEGENWDVPIHLVHFLLSH